MSTIRSTLQGDTVLITVEGDLTFASNRLFRDAYQAYQNTRFTVDLTRATYMDSAGLGMLIRLRDHAGGDRAKVTLR